MELLLCFVSFAIGIGILYCLYKITFYIKDKWGDFYGAIFVFAVVLFFLRDNPESNNSNDHKSEHLEFTSRDSVTDRDNGSVMVELGKNTLSRYNMRVKYGVSKSTHHKVPVEIGFIKTGRGDATELEVSSTRLEDVDASDRMEYFVDGMLNWKLLGFTVYRQPKSYHGFATLKCDMPANQIQHEN